ncbi:hypothetical protein C8J57DRAFT_1294378 [Mycena rebaudengoi]|nr:hypothetical protein C8J57DRAFT_1294378 [Mycena rebaudengoi]
MASLFPSGPKLPEFASLLVKGSYHPSAPIHLALSHAAHFPGTRTLLITPSRQTMVLALQNYNDDWISTHSGKGKTLDLASLATAYYPPSPAHLALLLTILSTDDRRPSLNPTTTLDRPPSLIILHELSAYFLPDVHANPNGHSWTLSSYMTLVVRAFSSFAALSSTQSDSPRISLALFDSQLDQLKLPVLRHPAAEENKSPSRLENVAFFVQKYFDLVAVFEEDTMFLNSSQEEENEELGRPRRNQMQLFRSSKLTPIETLRWIEQVSNQNSGGVQFLWDR